jgi:tRNA (guanine6-N2)-methyltransferase
MDYEVEVISGLEDQAEREIRSRLKGVDVIGRPRDGRISIRYRGDPRRLDDLRSVVAVYRVVRFAVPRPKALLGHESAQILLRSIREIVDLYPPGTFRTFHVSAAGAKSATFTRLKGLLARGLGLISTDEAGDLLVIFRRPPGGAPGWEVLARTSPRPLSARAWRVCDMPGALNASVAHVMVELADPSPAERFLNLVCGSGTLLIERLDICPARLAIGVDRSEQALACARENIAASRHAQEITLILADATRLPLPDASVDTVVADLPFGMLVGQRAEIERLYPEILREAARVAVPGATFVAITAMRKLFESALDQCPEEWHRSRVLPLKIPFRSGYVRPAIYVLRRR